MILFFRFRAKQRDYLHWFPTGGGFPLDTVVMGNPFGRDMRAIYR